mgnify:CR=1 FL=1
MSKLMGFTSFGSLVERCTRRRRSDCRYIVITPDAGTDMQAQIDHLGRHADIRPVVIVPGEKEAVLL